MSILDTIYESYLTGDLSVQPESLWIGNRPEYAELVKEFGLDQSQADKLENLLLDTVDGEGKNYFSAGFKLAVEFMSEITAKSEIGSEE